MRIVFWLLGLTLSVQSDDWLFYGNAQCGLPLSLARERARAHAWACCVLQYCEKDNGRNEVGADGSTVTGHTWFNR